MSIVTPERPVDAPSAPAPSRPHRTWWHAFNSVLALGAAVIGVIALTRDPATKTVEVPAPAPAATPSNLSLAWLGDPGPALGIPSDSYADGGLSSSATAGVPSDKYAGLGPILGLPSNIGPYVPASPATGGVPSDKYADLVPAGSVGVPSDTYADRIPAYQYDVTQQHAPVSPTGSPNPSWTGPR